MQGKTNLTDKIIRLCDDLPDFCVSFLLETGTELANTTRLEYARELNWFLDFLVNYLPDFCDMKKKDITISDIKKVTSQDISRYITLYRNQNKMERTLARKRAALSRFFSYLTTNRKIEYNPVTAAAKVKIHENDEVLHLNLKEQNDLLKDIDTGDHLTKIQKKYHDQYRLRDYAIIFLLLDTGMRVSELHGIDILDLNPDDCSVVVTRKGGKIQTLYYSDEARDILNEYIEERKEKEKDFFDIQGPLFVTKTRTRLSVRAIEVMVKKYTSSSIPGKGKRLSPHKMRSSFAMSYYGEEKDILALQRKLGHKNLTTTNVYAKASDTQMKETRSVISDARKGFKP